MAIDRIPGVGPTNADIATAVAAPSAATIASAVLSSGNSAGWGTTGGETWALVTSGTFNNTLNSYTLSGLSGYKTYQLIVTGNIASGNPNVIIRLNGVTTNYNYGIEQIPNGYSAGTVYYSNNDSRFLVSDAGVNHFYIASVFPFANLTGLKSIESQCSAYDTTGTRYWAKTRGTNTSITAAINSIQFATLSATFNSGGYALYGGN